MLSPKVVCIECIALESRTNSQEETASVTDLKSYVEAIKKGKELGTYSVRKRLSIEILHIFYKSIFFYRWNK